MACSLDTCFVDWGDELLVSSLRTNYSWRRMRSTERRQSRLAGGDGGDGGESETDGGGRKRKRQGSLKR